MNGNYTKIPNTLLDNVREFSYAELKVILVMYRKTYGWQKTEESISRKEISEKAGICMTTLEKVLRRLKNAGIIETETNPGKPLKVRVTPVSVVPQSVGYPSQWGIGTPLSGATPPPVSGVPQRSKCNPGKEIEHPKEKKETIRKKEYARGVKMTEEEYLRLTTDYEKRDVDRTIEVMSEYLGMHGKRYKDYNLAVRNWLRRDGIPKKKTKTEDRCPRCGNKLVNDVCLCGYEKPEVMDD